MYESINIIYYVNTMKDKNHMLVKYIQKRYLTKFSILSLKNIQGIRYSKNEPQYYEGHILKTHR
jgi:hypothetical protein